MSQPSRSSWQGFGRRVIGAFRLDGETYRELATTPAALLQAVAVIVLGSLASAVAFLVDGESPGLSVNVDWERYSVTRESRIVAALAGAGLDAGWGLLIWAAQAVIVWLLWNRFSRRSRTWTAIAVPLGFASAPLIVFGVLEAVPVIGGALVVVGLLWTAAASVAAVRASLDIGWMRALLLTVVSIVALLPVSFVLSRLT